MGVYTQSIDDVFGRNQIRGKTSFGVIPNDLTNRRAVVIPSAPKKYQNYLLESEINKALPVDPVDSICFTIKLAALARDTVDDNFNSIISPDK